MTKVKICGITNSDDAVKACELGADLLGFIFVEGTPRCTDPDTVKNIITDLPAQFKEKVGMVGLFKDEKFERIIETFLYCDLDYIQLHGMEFPDDCQMLKQLMSGQSMVDVKILKVFKVDKKILPQGKFDLEDYESVDYFVFDTFHPEIAGGTGKQFDWEALKKEKDRIKKDFFIAGGLDPKNVSEAVKAVHPYGVDVSSGVESSPGKKDEKLLKEFIENAKKI
jgi:phosphoribosylanthranilate isomerase